MLKWTLDPIWFELISSGKKTIEGRLPKFGVENIKPGDKVICTDHTRTLIVEVLNSKHYNTIREYLQENINEALPGTNSIDKGIEIYRKYISEKTENIMGINAIKIKVLGFQNIHSYSSE